MIIILKVSKVFYKSKNIINALYKNIYSNNV